MGGGCRRSGCSGEDAVKPRQQASVEAPTGPRGGRINTDWQRRRPEGGAPHGRPWCRRRLCRCARERWGAAFYRGRHLRRRFALAIVEAKSQHGAGTAVTWGGYGGDASGRAARSAHHGLCTRGAWREGSEEGRRCGDGRDHRARVGERTPRRPGPWGSHGGKARYGARRRATRVVEL
jgi:hypothetical protein